MLTSKKKYEKLYHESQNIDFSDLHFQNGY